MLIAEQMNTESLNIIAALSQAQGWQNQYKTLLQFAKASPTWSASERLDELVVAGCEVKVWVKLTTRAQGWQLSVDSDAKIVKGLLLVIQAQLAKLTTDQINQAALEQPFVELGLFAQLSPSRNNGIVAVIQHIVAQTGQ